METSEELFELICNYEQTKAQALEELFLECVEHYSLIFSIRSVV